MTKITWNCPTCSGENTDTSQGFVVCIHCSKTFLASEIHKDANAKLKADTRKFTIELMRQQFWEKTFLTLMQLEHYKVYHAASEADEALERWDRKFNHD